MAARLLTFLFVGYEFFFIIETFSSGLAILISEMGKKKIVIIDDEEDLCHLMKAFLVELDYDVFLAYTLTSGLQLMDDVSPDIAFIDNNLPDGSGWEKMTYLRKKFPNCKINLVSAYQYITPEMKDNSAGISILEKPLRLNAIKDYL